MSRFLSTCCFFFLMLGIALTGVSLTYAQTDVGNTITSTVKDIVQKKFEKETGLDKIKNLKDISPGKIADATVKYITKDTPSALMAGLIQQLKGENGEGLPSSFKPYLTKTHNKNVSYFTENACVRTANQRLMEGLGNAKVKANLAPWVDTARTAVKSIADGGKSLSQMIAEHTKDKVETMIKETLFGKAEPTIETVTIPHYDSCGSTTKLTRDPVNMRIIVITSGDCQCKRFTAKREGDVARLKDFTVTLVAPVTVVNVNIEEKKPFFDFRGLVKPSYKIQAYYKVGKLSVTTQANCQCSEDTPPPPPPKKKSWIAGFIGWITGIFDGSDDDKETDDEETDDEETDDDETDDDETDDEETDDDETDDEETDDEDTDDEEDKDTDKPLTCGDALSIDGRSKVATFPYQNTGAEVVNFNCNNACAPHQICKVLPESVGAFRDSCVYCADICAEGAFINLAACEAKATDKQTCVATEGSDCYSLQEKETPPSDCEQAIKTLLDVYLGWFDPPLTFSANGAVFTNGPARCLSASEFEQFHTAPLLEGATSAEILTMCPSLQIVSNENVSLGGEGKGALCETKTVFDF